MVYELLTREVIKRRNKSECSVRKERDMFIYWDEEGRENDEYVLPLYLLQRFSERFLFFFFYLSSLSSFFFYDCTW